MIAEVAVGARLEVKRVIAAVDAGEVINPDALVNQIEGGIVQAISWTLKEQVLWDLDARDHALLGELSDPALRRSARDRGDDRRAGRRRRRLGVGECAAGPTAAALANALYDAMGVRVRDLPLTPERIARAFG